MPTLKNLMIDIANPAYFRRLVAPFHNTPFIFGTNYSDVMKFLKSPGCADRPYACRSKLKFDQFNNRDTIHLQSIPCNIPEISNNH